MSEGNLFTNCGTEEGYWLRESASAVCAANLLCGDKGRVEWLEEFVKKSEYNKEEVENICKAYGCEYGKLIEVMKNVVRENEKVSKGSSEGTSGVMLFNCPDCKRGFCEGCPRLMWTNITTSEWNELGMSLWKDGKINPISIPNACRGCSNHPSNGGSGVCNCTLGMQNLFSVDLGHT